MNEWRETPLSSIADLSGGFAFKSGDYARAGRFILRTLNIRDDSSITRDDAVFLPEKLCPEYERFELEPGDTLFVMVGATLGKIGFVRSTDLPALLNQNMWRIRAKPEVADPRFVHYAFRYAVKSSLGWASGSARDFVRRDDYRNLLILVPSMTEQQAIGALLGALDDKIELNRRTNETLEDIVRALFKSWFIDFDPVRAKVEARAPTLPRRIADLFPDSFEDSELGEIPRGWQLGHFGDVADNPRRGASPSEIQPTTPYIALEHMPRKSIALSEWGTAAGVESGKFVFHAGEILFGKLRPYFHKVGVAPVDGVCSTDILVVIPKSDDWFGFVLGHVSSEAFVEYTNAGSTGTKMPRTNWTDMARYAVVLPPEPLAAAFAELIRPFISRILKAIHQSRTLGTLRNTLLPKLVSGEVRLRDAERIVGGKM